MLPVTCAGLEVVTPKVTMVVTDARSVSQLSLVISVTVAESADIVARWTILRVVGSVVTAKLMVVASMDDAGLAVVTPKLITEELDAGVWAKFVVTPNLRVTGMAEEAVCQS